VTSLAERVDLVIGVDTHKHTHTAAVVDATTGGTLSELTVSTDPGGYGELLTWVGAIRGGSRVWALEGGGGEQVVELDRPKRAARRHGAKSDSLDAVRAAREALAREHLARIKDDGPRAELAVLMAARRSGVEAATLAQRQLLALVTAAPEELRAVLRGANTTVTVQTAARLRTRSAWDRQTVTTANVLQDPGAPGPDPAGRGPRPRDRDR
jgi:hypothetical protein